MAKKNKERKLSHEEADEIEFEQFFASQIIRAGILDANNKKEIARWEGLIPYPNFLNDERFLAAIPEKRIDEIKETSRKLIELGIKIEGVIIDEKGKITVANDIERLDITGQKSISIEIKCRKLSKNGHLFLYNAFYIFKIVIKAF